MKSVPIYRNISPGRLSVILYVKGGPSRPLSPSLRLFVSSSLSLSVSPSPHGVLCSFPEGFQDLPLTVHGIVIFPEYPAVGVHVGNVHDGGRG